MRSAVVPYQFRWVTLAVAQVFEIELLSMGSHPRSASVRGWSTVALGSAAAQLEEAALKVLHPMDANHKSATFVCQKRDRELRWMTAGRFSVWETIDIDRRFLYNNCKLNFTAS